VQCVGDSLDDRCNRCLPEHCRLSQPLGQWLAYAQDRKLGDPRYSVSALRRDIRAARLQAGIHEAREAMGLTEEEDPNQWRCPWIRLYCTRSGRPVVIADCLTCEVRGGGPEAATNGEEP
jgi:hypothetical protein